jgi:cytochrome c oxidase assembly protein subunit 15
MPHSQDRLVMIWVGLFASLAIVLIIFGGYVRLTRSGLSIVEWNPVRGSVPPLSQGAWAAEFTKYQETPEYQQINRGISLVEYKRLFLIEWLHRLLARVAGLAFAIPFLVFVLTRRLPLRQSAPYFLVGLLFVAQALMGWVMVSSGLVERPSVSHYLLAAHLFLALALVGVSVWIMLRHYFGYTAVASGIRWSAASVAALAALLGLLLQIAYGAFTAGLKAGYVSDTWPMMLGRWIPGRLLGQTAPPALNLVAAPLTVAFIHRWLAVALLILAGISYHVIDQLELEDHLRRILRLIAVLSLLQMGVGIALVISRVEIALALLHQANAIALYVLTVILLYRLRIRDARSGRGAT